MQIYIKHNSFSCQYVRYFTLVENKGINRYNSYTCVRDSNGNPFCRAARKKIEVDSPTLAAPAWDTPK